MEIKTLIGFAVGVVAGATASAFVCHRLYERRLGEVIQQLNEDDKDAESEDLGLVGASEEDYCTVREGRSEKVEKMPEMPIAGPEDTVPVEPVEKEEEPMTEEERDEFLEDEGRHRMAEEDRAAEGTVPYLMTEEEFWNMEGETDGEEIRYLSYWFPDNIFTNEEDEVLKPEELKVMIGDRAVGECMITEGDEVFVRNPVRNLFYEIIVKREHFNAAL